MAPASTQQERQAVEKEGCGADNLADSPGEKWGLGNGAPWAGRFDKGAKTSERDHLCRMLHLEPKPASVITNAGYYGYEAGDLSGKHRSFARANGGRVTIAHVTAAVQKNDRAD